MEAWSMIEFHIQVDRMTYDHAESYSKTWIRF